MNRLNKLSSPWSVEFKIFLQLSGGKELPPERIPARNDLAFAIATGNARSHTLVEAHDGANIYAWVRQVSDSFIYPLFR